MNSRPASLEADPLEGNGLKTRQSLKNWGVGAQLKMAVNALLEAGVFGVDAHLRGRIFPVAGADFPAVDEHIVFRPIEPRLPRLGIHEAHQLGVMRRVGWPRDIHVPQQELLPVAILPAREGRPATGRRPKARNRAPRWHWIKTLFSARKS